MRLAALIVNFDSGALARALCESVVAQWRALGAPREDLELVVVDNASTEDQSPELARLAALGAHVVRSRENLGYAGGMNLAFAATRGGPEDLVLVLNPDLALFDGALRRLLDTVRQEPRAGAVGPRAFLDPARTLRLPPNRLPTPETERLAAEAQHDPGLAARLSAERTRHALGEWTATEPREVEMLSGACFASRRAALAAAGGLFDARYPLYFEDTDLCRRLARAGFTLLLEPRAEIVHHWARSSGVESGAAEPARRHRVSRAAYFERWFGPEARLELEAAEAALARPAPDPTTRFEALGARAEPPLLEFPRSGRWLVEVAMAPLFPLAAGAFVDGEHWRPDPRAFEWFYRGRYFVQALPLADLGDVRPARAWCFDKPTGARTAPLAPSELCDLPAPVGRGGAR